MPAVTTSPSQKSNSYVQQTMQNRMLMVVLSMVVLIPLLASPSNPYSQGLATKALFIMAGLLAGILVMRARVATRTSEVVTFFGVGPNLAVLLYAVYSAVSLGFLKDKGLRPLAFSEFLRILAGVLLYFALAYHVRRSEHLVKMLDALVFVAGLLAVLGLFTIGLQGASEQAVLFGDHQLFGAFLMILFPIPVVAALTERDAKRLITARVVAALTGICILMTGTRTAWFGATASLIALAVFSQIGGKRKGKNAKQSESDWKQYVLPILTVVACAAVFIAMSGGAGGVIFSRTQGRSVEESVSYRKHMWYAAEQLLYLNPVFGNGLGSFPAMQQPYSQNGRPRKVVLDSRPTLAEMAHNFWLQTAAEQGLIGVTLFGCIVLTFLIAGLRRLRFMDGGLRRSLLLACLAGIVGFTIDAAGNPAWQFSQVSMFFWLILGLGVASLRPRTVRSES